MDIFKSKIDLWLLGVMIFAVSVSLFAAIHALKTPNATSMIAGALTLFVGAGLPIWLLLSTQYVVTREKLKIQSGPFFWVIDKNSIHSVEPSKNPLSSPALSLDRLLIRYGNGKSILISPKERSSFCQSLGFPDV